tara:strand:- start:100 stop:282 length:183 start_codon:yes stop_codon:yes gene_type:complete
MPGSPYFDETPKGILTWPKLLTFSTPPLILTLFLAAKYELLLETFAILSLSLILLGFLRK